MAVLVACVEHVHDLHVRRPTSGMHVATAHLVASNAGAATAVLDEARTRLRTDYGIEHATLQVEPAINPDCHELDW